MRVGCFANGCCFGLPTGGWSGVVFPVASPAHFWQIAHDFVGLMEPPIAAHPTQLYELAGSLVCGVLALVLLRRRVVPGTAFLTFIGAFAAVRWANWQLRVHPDTLTNPAIYGPIYASVIVLAAGLVALRYRSGVRPSAAETSVDTAVGYRGR